MSFAIAYQSKNKASNNKTSTVVKPSSHKGGASSVTMTQESVIHLQQTIGNQAVQRLMRSNAKNSDLRTGIQTKLKLSQPGDVYRTRS